MKIKILMLSVMILAILFTGCGKKSNTGAGTTSTPVPTQAAATTAPTATTALTPTTAATTAPTQGATDVVTTASIVNTNDAFMKAISNTGTWIIAILQDMTIDQELVVEGEFKNGKKDDAGNELIQRKLAFYSQDENRNITARYTLTAPQMTFKSPMGSIQHGTFKGNLIVDVDNFQLIDATVDGNVTFTKQSYKDTFKMDETSKITGTQTVQK